MQQPWFALSQVPPISVASLPEDFDIRRAAERTRVLVVDDESLITDTTCAILNRNGFDASAAYSGEEAVEAALKLLPGVVLIDVLMPRMSGVELAIRLRKDYPAMRVILFSGQLATSEMIHQAEAQGYSFELFPKPIHPDELIARLRTSF